MDTSKFASMDKFKEMIEIEREFGSVQMGDPVPIKETLKESDFLTEEEKHKSLWLLVANKLKSTSKEFRKFKEIIKNVVIE